MKSVSKNLISFYSLMTWPILIQMISNFNRKFRKKFQIPCLIFYVFFFSGIEMLLTLKEKAFKH